MAKQERFAALIVLLFVLGGSLGFYIFGRSSWTPSGERQLNACELTATIVPPFAATRDPRFSIRGVYELPTMDPPGLGCFLTVDRPFSSAKEAERFLGFGIPSIHRLPAGWELAQVAVSISGRPWATFVQVRFRYRNRIRDQSLLLTVIPPSGAVSSSFEGTPTPVMINGADGVEFLAARDQGPLLFIDWSKQGFNFSATAFLTNGLTESQVRAILQNIE